MQDGFNIPEMCAALDGTAFASIPVADKLHYFASIGSTNACALQQAQAGAPEWSVYFADEQTDGRGRGGHSWHSEAGAGLYVSVLLRPRLSPADALFLSLATGIAVRAAIFSVTGFEVDIRWPNDLLLGKKKCGGILVETAASANGNESPELRHAVIGVGLNVNHAELPRDIATLATSLRMESGHAWQRQDLLLALLLALHDEVERLQTDITEHGTPVKMLERFSTASTWVRGKRVHVEEAGGYTGVTDGLNARGFLRVRTADGMRTVLSGGVRELH